MNWKRKEALREQEKRKTKPVVPRIVAVNMPNPKKEFVRLPIIFDWHQDGVPAVLVVSPNIMFDEICDSYYTAIRRAFGISWHSDSCCVLDQLQGGGYEAVAERHLHLIVFDPDRYSMSELMQNEDKMHALAKAHYERFLQDGVTNSIIPPISRRYMSEYTISFDGRTVGTGTVTNVFLSAGTWTTIS